MGGEYYVPTLLPNEEFEELERQEELERHDVYYKPDGDIVLRVQNTLFRVHRFLLSRDSSAFEDMFSMPRGSDSSPEGYSDDLPVYLEGENVDDFAELLSILYALPSELHSIRTDPTNVYRLLTVAQMTNKYHFVTTSSWAVSALCQVTECPTEPWRALRAMHHPPTPSWCTTPILRRIIEVALLCGNQLLCDHAVEKWVELIVVGYANPVCAMDVADEYGLARLKGISYYETLMACDDNLNYVLEPLIESERGEKRTMSPAQKASLLSGFFSLVRRWERLRESAPTFEKPDGCTYHAHGCWSTWQAVWKSTTKSEAMVHRRTVDVLGRLKAMAELLEADRDLRCALTPACRRAAMDSVKDLYDREEEELALHFDNLTRAISN